MAMNPQATTWRELIRQEMVNHGDSFAEFEGCTLDDAGLDVVFDADFGTPKGKPFTLWTKSRVYFPLTWDGFEDVGSVPRHPSDEPTMHIGGW